jgi:hypothetical protein
MRSRCRTVQHDSRLVIAGGRNQDCTAAFTGVGQLDVHLQQARTQPVYRLRHLPCVHSRHEKQPYGHDATGS